MSYIGRDISNLSDRVKLDQISTSATATFNLTLNGNPFVPSSAESLTISLNAIIQSPQDSYTVSGSTVIFASSLQSSDVIDFILAERAITLTTIGSGTVTASNIVNSSITNAKLQNSSITLNGSAVSLGGSATIGGGKIGQVLTTEVTAFSFSTTASSPVAITGLSRAITPSATSSKILVMGKVSFGCPSGTRGFIQLRRGTALIGNSIGSGSRVISIASENLASVDDVGNLNFHYIDSPNTNSEVTYNIYGNANGNSAFKLNRSNNDFNASQTTRGTSVITVMEVLA